MNENKKTLALCFLCLLFASTLVLAIGVFIGGKDIKDGLLGVSDSVDKLTKKLSQMNNDLHSIKSLIESVAEDAKNLEFPPSSPPPPPSPSSPP